MERKRTRKNSNEYRERKRMHSATENGYAADTELPYYGLKLNMNAIHGHVEDDSGYDTEATAATVLDTPESKEDKIQKRKRILEENRKRYEIYLENIKRKEDVSSDYETSDTELDEPEVGGKGKRQTRKRRALSRDKKERKGSKKQARKSRKHRRTRRT